MLSLALLHQAFSSPFLDVSDVTHLPDLSSLLAPLPLADLLQATVEGGAAAGTAEGGAGTAVVTAPAVATTAVPANMVTALMPGIGVGLLAGTFIAELLLAKNKKKQRYNYYDYHHYGLKRKYFQ